MAEKPMSYRTQILAFALDNYGVSPDYPWQRWPDFAVLRHQATRKWFGLIMNVSCDKLGLSTHDVIDILNVKVASAFDAEALKREQGILPAYHMNKDAWVSVRLDGTPGLPQIEELLAQSFNRT